jgi:UDP-N-acetyl-D-mannosaminuronate dehydrogenase
MRAGIDEGSRPAGTGSNAVSDVETVLVVGLGEIGRPLLELASSRHDVVGLDVHPPTSVPERVDVMHICYPFEIRDFIGDTARYVERFRPDITIINSTVGVGTTRAIGDRTGAPIVHSPVRGKHARMRDDLLTYTKFVGASDPVAGKRAGEHFWSLGVRSRILSSPEATELAKLTETTYFGVLIAWAQEIERYCDQVGQDYDEVVSFYDEIKCFPTVKYFPGIIGGHCVMPNIEILSRLGQSEILEAIRVSNRKKIERDTHKGRTGDRRA